MPHGGGYQNGMGFGSENAGANPTRTKIDLEGNLEPRDLRQVHPTKKILVGP